MMRTPTQAEMENYMSLKWETELKEPIEDDDADDIFHPDDGEDDSFDCRQCAADPCLSDWMRTSF